MDSLIRYWEQGDAIGRAVAVMLLIMSIGAWVVIFWKGWMLTRARRDLVTGAQAFWRAADLPSARLAIKDLEDCPSHKRSEYRRRNDCLQQLQQQLAQTLQV